MRKCKYCGLEIEWDGQWILTDDEWWKLSSKNRHPHEGGTRCPQRGFEYSHELLTETDIVGQILDKYEV